MRVFLLTILLITACLSEDEASVSQSGAVTGQDLTKVKSPAYIKPGECLIDIKGTLALGSSVTLPPLNSCLPSSQLSWLFRAQEVKEERPADQHLQLAILFDTSYSLYDNDRVGKRYEALSIYLEALHTKIKEDKNTSSRIVSAHVKIYPFKYCDRNGNHELKIDANAIKIKKIKNDNSVEFVEEKLEELIGGDYTFRKKEGEPLDIDNDYSNELHLTDYGMSGATNYLHSLSKAIGFLDSANKDDLKQVLIFSDGLPLTFNDGTDHGGNNTITLSALKPKCPVEHKYDYADLRAQVLVNGSFAPTDGIKACVTDKFYPNNNPNNNCERPTANSLGQTNTGTSEQLEAWSDPLNHVLGMVQHSTVINKAKEDHNFQVYAVLLRPSTCDAVVNPWDWDKIICQEITTHLAKPFFESFAHYAEASNAGQLAAKLEATLDAQTRPIDYHQYGKASLPASSKDGRTIEVDNPTQWHKGNFIKVGRDNENDTVYKYKDNAQDTLTVKHGLYGRGGSFKIGYAFEFSEASKGKTDCRSTNNRKIGNLEVNKYAGSGYTAWCLLAPRCDSATKVACQGKADRWNAATCTCLRANVADQPPPLVVQPPPPPPSPPPPTAPLVVQPPPAPLVVQPPTTPHQTDNGGGGGGVTGQRPENPEKTGSTQGEDGDKIGTQPQPRPGSEVTEGMVWGDFESF